MKGDVMDNPKIRIKHVHGGEDKSYLQQCYFEEKGHTNGFLFFTKDGGRILTYPSIITSGQDFSFKLPSIDGQEIEFQVTEFCISDVEGAHGRWSVPIQPGDDDDGDPETGTFQAPGGHPIELSAGASGSA